MKKALSRLIHHISSAVILAIFFTFIPWLTIKQLLLHPTCSE